MNVRLGYDLKFLAGIYYQDQLQLNAYTLRMGLLTQSSDSRFTNVAMDRVNHFVHGVLANTVFVEHSQPQVAQTLKAMGVNVTTLPEQPIDQIIGIMLYHKLNAIMEGQMIITELEISSALGDSVRYLHDATDASGPFAEDGWWHRSSMQHSDVTSDTQQDNVFRVAGSSWRDVDLEWPDQEVAPDSSTVVFANFPKNEK